jgi:hypothetical protein
MLILLALFQQGLVLQGRQTVQGVPGLLRGGERHIGDALQLGCAPVEGQQIDLRHLSEMLAYVREHFLRHVATQVAYSKEMQRLSARF